MHFKAILFDLDGTLLDTLDDIASSVDEVLLKNDLPTHSLDDYRSFISDGISMLIMRSLPKDRRDEQTISECVKEFQKAYGLNWNNRTQPYEGVIETLGELAAHGLILGIISNKSHDFTIKCVDTFLPDIKFDFVLGLQEGIPPKPDPTGANSFSEKMGIPPEQILFVGDSGTDVKTAVAAGMFPVGVLWGFKSLAELRDSGARELIEHPKEILLILKKLIPKICN